MTAAAIYLRQSLDVTGEGVAIARQREDCLKLCAEKGWTPAEYVDNDTSASKGKRPGYLRMLADIEAGRIQAVVAWDLDRLHRRPIELEDFIGLADRHRIALATVSGDVDLSTAQGRLIARLKGSVARHEIEHKSARQKRAHKQKAESGQPNWPVPGFGFGVDFEPDPQIAPLIRDAYASVLAGASHGDIAREWNRAGVATSTGKPWINGGVGVLLRRPRNAGLRAHNGVIVGPGTWAPIVSESTYRAYMALVSDPARKPVQRVRRHLLTGILVCGECGNTLQGGARQSTQRAAVGTSLGYRCAPPRGCNRVSISQPSTEALIRGIVIERLGRADASDLLIDREAVDLDALADEASAIRSRMDSLAVDFADGVLTSSQLRAATSRLADNLAAVESKMQDSTRVLAFADMPLGTPEVAEAFDSLGEDRKRALIGLLFTATVHKAKQKGGKRYDPQRVQIEWKS